VILLEGRSEVVSVTVIILQRPATIQEDVGQLVALGAENFMEATLREASSSKYIRNMDSVHPVHPFRLDAGLNSYRDAVNNCPQIPQINTD
jgi:acetate kinase